MSIESSLVYIENNNKLLMLHRNKKKDNLSDRKWNGLGGKLMKGESPEECAIREVKEESGLNLHKLDLIGHIMFPYFDDINDWSVFIFISDSFSGNLLKSCPEGELYWKDKNEILNLNLWEGDKKFIPFVLKKEPFYGKIVYKNKTFIESKINKFALL